MVIVQCMKTTVECDNINKLKVLNYYEHFMLKQFDGFKFYIRFILQLESRRAKKLWIIV